MADKNIFSELFGRSPFDRRGFLSLLIGGAPHRMDEPQFQGKSSEELLGLSREQLVEHCLILEADMRGTIKQGETFCNQVKDFLRLRISADQEILELKQRLDAMMEQFAKESSNNARLCKDMQKEFNAQNEELRFLKTLHKDAGELIGKVGDVVAGISASIDKKKYAAGMGKIDALLQAHYQSSGRSAVEEVLQKDK